MSQGLAKVKHRIGAVQSTRKITNSMKLVSSAKLRKINKIVQTQDTYLLAMERVFNDAIFYNSINEDIKIETPYAKENEEAKKDLYILVTSNLGLCAGYNANILKLFRQNFKPGDDVICIGEKGYINLRKEKNLNLITKFSELNHNSKMYHFRLLSDFALEGFINKDYRNVYIVYTHYRNSISFIPKVERILPLKIEENKRYKYEPIYEPNKEQVIDYVVKEYLKTKIHRMVIDSFLSEESSRRNAMDNADKSAKDLIDKLKLEYNKARQSAITQEITEVVNGSNAVK